MIKQTIILILVICSQFIPLANSSNDDDFAEFDGVKNQESNYSPDDAKLPNTDKSVQDKQGSKPESGKSDLGTDIADETKTDDPGKEQKKPDLKLVDAPLPRVYSWESYYVEIAFLVASILYLISYFAGCNRNTKISQEWFQDIKPLLKQYFVLVGGAPIIDLKAQKRDEDAELQLASMRKQKGLIKMSESMSVVYCSGRVGIEGLLVEINLLKRQDLFSMALNLLKSSRDNLIFRFLLQNDGFENFVFCLLHKSHATKLVRDMIDISTFCSKRKPLTQIGIDIERFYVMTELNDVIPFILDSNSVAFLKKYEKSVNYIHITDQFSTVRSDDTTSMLRLANPKRMATFSFNLPTNSNDRMEFFMFSLGLLDRLRKFKLARESKQKSEKNRQKITDILQKTAFSQRQEAAQAKKEEARRLEKERIFSEDDVEKQRRWEKKEAKRELKKSKQRVKQLKVKSM